MSRQVIAPTRSSASWAAWSFAWSPSPSLSASATATRASLALPYAMDRCRPLLPLLYPTDSARFSAALTAARSAWSLRSPHLPLTPRIPSIVSAAAS